MTADNRFLQNRKYIAVNFVLFAVLFLSVSFNKTYIRPTYGHTAIVGVFTGSFSNFMAAWIISLFPFAAIRAQRMSLKRARLVFHGISVLVFAALAVEEIAPYTGASSTFDVFDLMANGFGSLAAIAVFEVFLKKRLIQ
jgi:type IV secretory pathway VirB2 component (pilin)